MKRSGIQEAFFARIGDSQAVRAVFNHMPGVFFFVKDAQGRHIACNTPTFPRFGIRSESELIGTTDERWFPEEVAKAFREDDQRVIRTGKPLINRLEVWYDEQRNLAWFLTTKLPVRDRKGEIIGVMGITRRDEERMLHHDVREVTEAVKQARRCTDRNLKAAELARMVGLSERHLHRKLQETLGITPHELLLRARIQASAEALAKTSAPIIEIALQYGFCDQSAFTQQFRKRTGLTPKQFRLRHRI